MSRNTNAPIRASQITSDYKLRGKEYELWIDGANNWWLCIPGGDTEFDTEDMTHAELDAIGQYIYDWRSDP